MGDWSILSLYLEWGCRMNVYLMIAWDILGLSKMKITFAHIRSQATMLHPIKVNSLDKMN